MKTGLQEHTEPEKLKPVSSTEMSLFQAYLDFTIKLLEMLHCEESVGLELDSYKGLKVSLVAWKPVQILCSGWL